MLLLQQGHAAQAGELVAASFKIAIATDTD